ncbi:MAG TPA: bifunctional phosphopantothenoylcysteine decarboxylase/phosphopantothenate--cysteine ligase CoaBC [Patescibacteria group bacterium]
MKRHVVLGVTSGIAAYKTLNLMELLSKAGIEISVIMTKRAAQMIDPGEFEKISGNKVYTELFTGGFDYKKILKERQVEHIDLADKADVLVIVPATANMIGKLASGLADDYLTTTTLAVTAPIIVAPAMNVHMWTNPVVKENVARLKNLNYQIIEPETGLLACGYEGQGRLASVEVIRDEILRQLNRTQQLKGKKIIVTAGGTSEKIDEVRSITNRSSGKMGVALAEELYLRGAQVLLLRAKKAVSPRYLMQEEIFETAEDLLNLLKKHSKSADVFYHVAAVADFTPEKVDGKISSKTEFNLKLKPQVKILDLIKMLNPKIRLIAFKAEYGLPEKELLAAALKRLQEAKADVIIANDISKKDSGFEVDANEVLVVFPNGTFKKIALGLKREIAAKIIDLSL